MLILCKVLINLLTLKAYHRFNNSIINERLESMTRQLSVSLNAVRNLTQNGLDNCREADESDEDDDDDDAASDDTDEDSEYDISFYLNLLMNLSPSMEQVYSQAMKDREDSISMNAGDRPMPHTTQPLQLSMVANREKPQSHSRITISETLTDKAFCKSLRKRFIEVMQKKSRTQNKKLWPKSPIPPGDQFEWRFLRQLRVLSKIPLEYENSAFLDGALSVVPLDTVYREADEEHLLKQAQALSLGPGERPQLGYHDCVIRALLRYAVAFLQKCTS